MMMGLFVRCLLWLEIRYRRKLRSSWVKGRRTVGRWTMGRWRKGESMRRSNHDASPGKSGDKSQDEICCGVPGAGAGAGAVAILKRI